MSKRRISAKRLSESKTGEWLVDEVWRGESLFLWIRLPKDLDPRRRKFSHKVAERSQLPADEEACRQHTLYRSALAAAVRHRNELVGQMDVVVSERESRGDSRYPITFSEAVSLHETVSKRKTIKDLVSLLRRHANPRIGRTLVASLTFLDIIEVLEKAAKSGLSRQTVIHLKNGISAVIQGCYKRDQIPNLDMLKRVELPEFAASAVETRPREVLTDAEFLQLIQCEKVALEMRVMAASSRLIGGMRLSDLMAWDWAMIDTEGWTTCHVPRPKTSRVDKRVVEQRHRMPALAVQLLKLWWMQAGRPVNGPVFGKRRRRRIGMGQIGDRRVRAAGFAERLRRALTLAGVKRHALHHETPTRLPVDFHSFRRAYCTAIAASGLNAQQSMALAGHTSMVTHKRYLSSAEVLEIPDAAVPNMGAPRPPKDDAKQG